METQTRGPQDATVSVAALAKSLEARMVLSLRRHDPDQVQRVFAASATDRRTLSSLDRSSPRNTP